jgi:hypothetical protein
VSTGDECNLLVRWGTGGVCILEGVCEGVHDDFVVHVEEGYRVVVFFLGGVLPSLGIGLRMAWSHEGDSWVLIEQSSEDS